MSSSQVRICWLLIRILGLPQETGWTSLVILTLRKTVMPSSLINIRRDVTEQQIYPGGPPGKVSDAVLWYKNHFRTSSTKRVKPSDLFASGTAFTVTDSEVVTGHCVADYMNSRFSGPGSYFHGAGHSLPLPSSIESDLAYLRQIGDARIRGRIKDMNVNLAQSVAEYRQVCSMFGRAAGDVVSAIRSLRSGKALKEIYSLLSNPKDPVSKRVANRWLEYQYGLKPLISDIYGFADELGKNLDSGIPRYLHTKVMDLRKGSTKFSAPLERFPYVNSTVQSFHYRVRARYLIRRPGLKQVAQLGITNPALLAWELLPYSFVVDWMFPVGDYLSSLDALTGIEDLKVIRGYLSETRSTSVGVTKVDSADIWKRRTAVSSNLSLPSLRYNPSTSLTAVLNGLALLRQLR